MTETTTDEAVADETAFEEAGSQESALDLLPPARTPDMGAIVMLREHVGAMRDAKFFADGICYTALVPDRFRNKPNDGAAAILYGAEIGLSPIAALRSVIVIHGQPGLEARTMKALLKSKGYRFKTHESTDDACDMEVWSPDGEESERCRFTMDEARKAGWVATEIEPGKYATNDKGKIVGNAKYLTEPRTMLRAKACAVICREIAPHILLGMPYSVDELVDQFGDMEYADPAAAPAQREPKRGGGVDKLRERARGRKQQRGDVVDAEVVDDADSTDQQQHTESATPEVPIQPDVTPEVEPEVDIEMSAADRTKELAMMHGLLINGGIATDEIDATWEAVSEIAAKRVGYRKIQADKALSNVDLKYVVDTLREWKQKGKLSAWLGEALNNASLREAGMLES